MTILKIEMKVNIHCDKCINTVFMSATKLLGIDEISADIEKGTVTVVGDVDPVKVAEQIRKTGKVVEIVTVGPPKEPEKPKPDNECELICPWPWGWPSCVPPPPPPAPCFSKGPICWPI